MARFRQSMAKRPIVSNKEIVDSVTLLVSAGVTTTVNLANTINDYAGTIGTQPLGSKILGFYLEISYNLSQVIVGRFDWYLAKRNSGRAIVDYPAPGATGGNVLRKSIYHERKGVLDGGTTSNAGGQTSKSVEFIKIPRGAQRMGENDFWTIFASGSTNYSMCIKCIYKWYE